MGQCLQSRGIFCFGVWSTKHIQFHTQYFFLHSFAPQITSAVWIIQRDPLHGGFACSHRGFLFQFSKYMISVYSVLSSYQIFIKIYKIPGWKLKNVRKSPIFPHKSSRCSSRTFSFLQLHYVNLSLTHWNHEWGIVFFWLRSSSCGLRTGGYVCFPFSGSLQQLETFF